MQQNPFEQTYNNDNGTIIDHAFNNGHASIAPNLMPMPMPLNNQNQFVPNVMMDTQDEQFQQQNVNPNFMSTQQGDFAGATQQQQQQQQQQAGTYDLNVPPFDIEDPLLRRQFFRKVFTILLIQNLCALPIMELFMLCTSEPIEYKVSSSFWLFGFLIFIAMYVFSDYRRYSPVNYMALIFTTIFVGIQAGMYATNVGHVVALTSQLTLVIQFAIMMAFTQQARFKFTNLNGIFLAIFVYLVFSAIIGVVSPHFPHAIELWIAFSVMYSVYDMQLQLSGHHGYNLKAEEHIFGAANIYADMPNLLWRFFRYIFIDHFVRMFQFFKKCCFAEVC